MRYEDMMEEPIKAFGDLANFLRVPAASSQIEAAVVASSFDKLRKEEEEQEFAERSDTAGRLFREGKRDSGVTCYRPRISPGSPMRAAIRCNALTTYLGPKNAIEGGDEGNFVVISSYKHLDQRLKSCNVTDLAGYRVFGLLPGYRTQSLGVMMEPPAAQGWNVGQKILDVPPHGSCALSIECDLAPSTSRSPLP